MNTRATNRPSERGSAGVKFLLIFVVLVVLANAGYNYVPVAYAGENFKADMQTAVINGLAVPGRFNPVDVIKDKVQRSVYDNGLPPNTVVEVKQVGNAYQARAVYTQPIHILPFGLYTYNYQFDYTAVPVGYLMKDSK
ncbi:MAG TPA: hypothetical protein VEV84_09770 [Pyrinomonadaceae bacterium]|nr:hypothetical protein [Pyrinomonadaceae bacterium]